MDIRLKPARGMRLAAAVLVVGTLLVATVLLLDLRPAAAPGTLAPPGAVHFSPPSGTYDGDLTIALSSPHPDAAIYFTTDGSIPAPETATLYTEPIHLPGGQPHATVLRARVVLPDGEMGDVNSATYFMNIDADIPLISLIFDPVDLWNQESGIFANPRGHGRVWERPTDFFYYDPQLGKGIQTLAGARVHGGGSRFYDKKSVRLYFRDEYGLPALEFPLFPDADTQRFEQIVIHNGGQDFPAVSANGTLIRNHLVSNLVRKIGGFTTYTRPVLLFINGRLWGIYNIRERINERYLQQGYQIDEADLLGGFESITRAAAGNKVHWNHMIAFAEANDLTDKDNYDYIQTQVNLDNFIDYILIQIITANADWPFNNQLRFRDRDTGRWHWMFWDSDYTFGLISAIYIDKDMYERALDPEGTRNQQVSILLKKLLENPEFKNQFLARLADLLNTTFTSENMLQEIDQLAETLEKDIVHETRRWPGSGNWKAGVEYMRDFARRRPDVLRSQTLETFDLPGMAQLTFNRPESGRGSISINGGPPLSGQDLPWQGVYFQDVAIDITAIPDAGYRFAGWIPQELPQNADLSLTVSGDLVLTPRFVRSDGNGPLPGSVKFSAYGRDGASAPVPGLEGDWVTLQVRAPGGADLRGWRVTDNDSLTAQDEGSLIIGDHAALADVPLGTTILLVAEKTPRNDRLFAGDDLSALDGQMVLYAGGDNLDTGSDPWFALGDNDTLVLLAPGATAAFEDDLAIDFLAIGDGSAAVSPSDFDLP